MATVFGSVCKRLGVSCEIGFDGAGRGAEAGEGVVEKERTMREWTGSSGLGGVFK